MIKTNDAIRIARSLIGMPYSELDCINLIKKVIRTAPGGEKGYTTAGTNALWDSANASKKYRDLTERHEGLAGIPAGALPFKRYGAAGEDHVGIATGEGTVIHSSSVNGRGVVETPLTAAEGWDCWGVHRYIEIAGGEKECKETNVTAYKMQVCLQDTASTVNVRKGPGKKHDIIGRLGHGAIVTVQEEMGSWALVVDEGGGSGYVSKDYLAAYAEPEPEKESIREWTSLIDENGSVIILKGDWHVAWD